MPETGCKDTSIAVAFFDPEGGDIVDDGFDLEVLIEGTFIAPEPDVGYAGGIKDFEVWVNGKATITEDLDAEALEKLEGELWEQSNDWEQDYDGS